MLDVIEKLLIVQDRDRKLRRVESELAQIGPERQNLLTKASSAETHLEKAKHRSKEIESKRKNLELEVESKKQLIVRYANQQLQTRKNDEYQALTKEIDGCKAEILKLEDQQIELMEQGETAQKDIAEANQRLALAKKNVEELVSQLDQREQSLEKQQAQLKAEREQLAAAVDPTAIGRYERLLKSKGENVVVGVTHGVCGGCHMRLPPQLLVACQAEKEMVPCSNCGRILYYASGMDLAIAD